MNDNLSKFLADAKGIHMNAQEHADCKESIFSKANPVCVQSLSVSAQEVSLTAQELHEGKQALFEHMRKRPLFSPRLHVFSMLKLALSMRFVSGVMVVVLLVATTGGVSYAAEDTVPGDLLYPVKVDFTEPIMERFQWTPRRKADYSKRRMERRMDEMEMLLKTGEPIPADVLGQIAKRMEYHSSQMEEYLASISSDDEADAMRTKLEERLKKHEEILTRVKNGTIDPQELINFRKSIERHRGKMHDGMRKKHYELRQAIEKNPELHEVIQERRGEFQRQNPEVRMPPPRGMLISPEERGELREDRKDRGNHKELPVTQGRQRKQRR